MAGLRRVAALIFGNGEGKASAEPFEVPNHPVDPKLQRDIHRFFETLEGMSVQDSCSENGLELILASFKKLLEEQECYNALNNFHVLLEEKGEDDPFRADITTPNILHEIRNCAYILGKISTGYIPMDEYLKHGGLDADLSARLRHDSIEDKAKRKIFDIYAGMEKNLERLYDDGILDVEGHYCKRIEATLAAEMIDSMTRKDAEIDTATGQIVRKPNGKISKIERYGGNIALYWKAIGQYPLAVLAKYDDRIENVDTRYGVPRFTLQSNQKYARDTRQVYGTESYDDKICAQWPEFEPAIRASDSMLGIQLALLEMTNYCFENPNLSPRTGNPIRIDDYAPQALHAYQTVPEVFHPISVSIHSLLTHHEKPELIKEILKFKYIPAIRAAESRYGLNPINGLEKDVFEFFGPIAPMNTKGPGVSSP